MQNDFVSIPRGFAQELLNYFLEQPMKVAEIAVNELRRSLNEAPVQERE